MKFGQLILRRIAKIVATKCQIVRLKCTKIGLQRSPDPQLDLRGPTSKGRGYRKGGEGRGRGRQGQGKNGRGGKEVEGRGPRVYL